VILQSIGNFTPNTTVSHPEGLEPLNLKFQAHGSMHHNSILIKIQLDAKVGSLIYFTVKSLYMFWVSQHPSSGVLKTVTEASSTVHNIGTATSLQHGQARSRPGLAMLEGSSTGGCGYSF